MNCIYGRVESGRWSGEEWRIEKRKIAGGMVLDSAGMGRHRVGHCVFSGLFHQQITERENKGSEQKVRWMVTVVSRVGNTNTHPHLYQVPCRSLRLK